MMKVIEKLRGFDRVTVGENERVLVFEKGLVSNVLSAGEHLLKTRGQKSDFEWFDITNPVFVSHVDRIMFEKLPVIADQHFVEFRTSNEQVAVIERDGVIFAVMKPDERLIVWKDAGPWNAQTFNLEESLKVNSAMVRRLGQAGKAGFMTLQPIVEGQAGLLYVDGQLIETIGPGVHAFWSVGKMVQVKVIDLRWQSLDVTGQEVLTRDRVTIRVNLAAEYRVADAIAAVTETKDFADAFYRALQYAFRRTLGARTLDQTLEQKASVDMETAAEVREAMAAIGIEVRDIVLKDIILPGEMREILNQVVSAQKEAEANIIRRREETNATRSLLNTAKVMAENPVMLRLKELEALETIAGRVERLTINNGTAGLLNDVAKLQ